MQHFASPSLIVTFKKESYKDCDMVYQNDIGEKAQRILFQTSYNITYE